MRKEKGNKRKKDSLAFKVLFLLTQKYFKEDSNTLLKFSQKVKFQKSEKSTAHFECQGDL